LPAFADVFGQQKHRARGGLGNTGLDVVRTAAPLDVAGPTATVRLQPYEIGTWLVRLA